ncbi:MAG: YicC/YloC family endoribonuclease [Pseudomonadota bacterium]
MTSPLYGMTGFARAEAAHGETVLRWELRSVNGRGLDTRLRLSSGWDGLEPQVRARLKAAFARGSISASLSVEHSGASTAVSIDETRLKAYAEAARKLMLADLAEPARADGLLGLRGVINGEEGSGLTADDEAGSAAALVCLDAAIEELTAARAQEGAAMGAVLGAVIDEIEALTAQASEHASTQPAALRDRLKARLAELIEGGIDEDRLAQEAAMLAAKADVREELDRLRAHIDAARALLAAGSPAGRKLDFLSQEFNREANTLCSKSTDRTLTEIGLALKTAIDQLREQVQNVE